MGSHRPDIGERNGNGNSRSVTLPKPRRHRLKQELTRPVPAGAHYGRTRPGANRHGLSRAQEERRRSGSTDLAEAPPRGMKGTTEPHSSSSRRLHSEVPRADTAGGDFKSKACRGPVVVRKDDRIAKGLI